MPMDEETRKLLEAEAKKLADRMERAQRIASQRVPIAGTMHKVLPPGERRTAKIDYKEARPGELAVDNLQAALSDRPDRICPPGTYTRLLTKRVPEDPENSEWCVMMTDAPYEIRSSMEFIENARGSVLVAGLGLGATLLPVLRKKKVTTVTVLEKNPDVISLVEKHIRRRAGKKQLNIIQADAHTWTAGKGWLWDTIWLDIWPDVSAGNLVDMRVLRKKFSRWLASDGWLGVWEWDFLHEQDARIARELDAAFAPVGGRNPMKAWDPDKKVAITIDGREIKL